MNWDLNYLIETCLAAVCAAAVIPIFIKNNGKISGKVKKYFYQLLIILLADGIVSYFDHVLSFAPDNRFELLRIFLSVISYTVQPLMLYIMLLILTRNSEGVNRRLYGIPVFITLIFSMSAFFNKGVFFIDEQNVLNEGPFIMVLYLVLFAYYLLIIIENLKKMHVNATESRIIFVIVGLLFADVILSLNFKNIDIHEQVKSLSVIMYFMYFLSEFHNEKLEELHSEFTEVEENLTKRMLKESLETLAYAIDSKDINTKGHSFRVARYARQIAELAERDQETCSKVYMAGLVHDIGKISVTDEVIGKKGKLTPSEYELIKKHPDRGARILKKMKEYPFLEEAAAYHHEYYDGSGYPEGLKGDAIPEIARIIAVADAYDAMTSEKTYRPAMNQADVKQEIWKGVGTKFDPYFAKLMISLIDADLDYNMREKPGEEEEFSFEEENEKVTWGIKKLSEIKEENQLMMETDVFMLGRFASIVDNWATPTKAVMAGSSESVITFFSSTKEDAKYLWFAPAAIIFASENGNISDDDYDELGVFESHGYSWRAGSSVSESSNIIRKLKFNDWDQWIEMNHEGSQFAFTVHREGSLVYITLDSELLRIESELVLPDGFNKNIYMAVTGEGCAITEVQ